jgi:DNA repair protein RadC
MTAIFRMERTQSRGGKESCKSLVQRFAATTAIAKNAILFRIIALVISFIPDIPCAVSGNALSQRTSHKRNMAINDWPEDQRPRERLIKNGAQVLSDAELLAVFLRVGVTGKSAVDLGRDMLGHFGSLTQLFNATLADFSELNGLGPAKYAQLQATLELARRSLTEELRAGEVLSSPQAVKQYLQLLLARKPYESFAVLFLDVKNRLIAAEELFRGTLMHTSVYPREVVKAALARNAASLILAHNHPSGSPDPSAADHSLTAALKQALALVDVRVLDHFVVAGRHVYSFAEHGQM